MKEREMKEESNFQAKKEMDRGTGKKIRRKELEIMTEEPEKELEIGMKELRK